eukprot:symbB.v1.2.027910.t1/scaffold2900.1/size67660/3
MIDQPTNVTDLGSSFGIGFSPMERSRGSPQPLPSKGRGAQYPITRCWQQWPSSAAPRGAFLHRHAAGKRGPILWCLPLGIAWRAAPSARIAFTSRISRRVRKAKIVQMEDDLDDPIEEEDDPLDYEDDENYEGPWQHALSLLQAMQARRLQLGEINVGSAVQACLAVRTSKSPMSSRWQQALMLFRTASTKRVLPDPACCGLLIAECEQRGLQSVEEDIMSRLREPSAVEDEVLVTATAVANDIVAKARTLPFGTAMGINDDELVDKASAALRCSICLSIFTEPVFCAGTPCQHVFCKSCLTRALEKRKNCPMCKAELDPAEMRPNILARNLVDELRVRCRHHALGCAWQGTVQERATHETSCLVVTNLRLTAEVDLLCQDVQSLHEENRKLREENLQNRQDISMIMKELQLMKHQSLQSYELAIPRKHVQILCKNFSGKTYSFRASLDEKVSDLKESISKKFDIEPDIFKLMYCLKPLPEQSLLEENGLESEPWVSLCINSQLQPVTQLIAKDKQP